MKIKAATKTGVGAYIEGVELDSLTDRECHDIRAGLGEYGVLFFRNQSLSPEQHIAFAEKFGTININRFFTPLSDYPQIAQVLKEADNTQNIGELWHTDHSYDQVPALGSVLVARDLPKTGGDTRFLSMFAAYDALDDSMKKRLSQLTATHSSRHVFGNQAYLNGSDRDLTGRLGNAEAATQDSVHPVVIKHPISGKSALYVNPQLTLHINEVSAAESENLLAFLYEHAQQERFMKRFKWEDGSVAFWDNRATWHQALNDYPGQRRLMHRITVEGVGLE